MFPSFPYFSSFDELKEALPSKPKPIEHELAYRKACVKIILACGPPIHLHHATLHKAVVLMHRFFTRCSSNDWQRLQKYAIAAACVFLAAKIDSAYTRLENVAHVAYRQMKDLYNNSRYDAEYFNPDGTPGNPKFLSYLSHLVCQAESRLLFAINFDFNVEVASSMVIYQLNELGLTHERAAQDPAVRAVRKDVMCFARASLESCSPKEAARSVSFLLYNAREIALACIWKACRRHDVPLEWHNMSRRCYVPDLNEEQLAEIEAVIPVYKGESSRAATPAVSSGAASSRQQGFEEAAAERATPSNGATAAGGEADAAGGYEAAQAQHSFQNRVKQEEVSAAEMAQGSRAKHEPGVPGASLGDGSQVEAATVGPRVSRSPISPDSQTGPAAFAAAGAAGASSSGAATQQQQQSRKRMREDGVVGYGMMVAPEQIGGVVAA